MGFIVYMFFLYIIIIIGFCIWPRDNGSRSAYYGGRYFPDYEAKEYKDYAAYETAAATGDRDYFSDDPAQNYNSYYAQVADDAMMGDESAVQEMLGEF